MTVHIDKGNYLTLGQLNAKLGIVSVTAKGLDDLGVQPAYIVGNARYYAKDAAELAGKAIARYFLGLTQLYTIAEPGHSQVQTCLCTKRLPPDHSEGGTHD